jgi:hypothetical protein
LLRLFFVPHAPWVPSPLPELSSLEAAHKHLIPSEERKSDHRAHFRTSDPRPVFVCSGLPILQGVSQREGGDHGEGTPIFLIFSSCRSLRTSF